MTTRRAVASASRLAAVFASVTVLVACGAQGDVGGATRRSTPGGSAPGVPYRVLADERGLGGEPAITVIDTPEAFATWWRDAGGAGTPPSFEPEHETVLALVASYPSGCEFPFLSLDVDVMNREITARYGGHEPAVCAADENPLGVVAAVDRRALPRGTWSVSSSVTSASASFDVP